METKQRNGSQHVGDIRRPWLHVDGIAIHEVKFFEFIRYKSRHKVGRTSSLKSP